MRRYTYVLIGGAMLAGGAALAKLPPLPPEEQATLEAKKAAQEEQLAKEKAALEREQDRVVKRYQKEKGGTNGSRVAARPSDDNLPKTVKEPDRGVGPNPGLPQSAEAHSGPAK